MGFTDREKLIMAIAIMNTSEKASNLTPQMLGNALELLRKTFAPSIPSEQLQPLVDEYQKEKKMILVGCGLGFLNSMRGF